MKSTKTSSATWSSSIVGGVKCILTGATLIPLLPIIGIAWAAYWLHASSGLNNAHAELAKL